MYLVSLAEIDPKRMLNRLLAEFIRVFHTDIPGCRRLCRHCVRSVKLGQRWRKEAPPRTGVARRPRMRSGASAHSGRRATNLPHQQRSASVPIFRIRVELSRTPWSFDVWAHRLLDFGIAYRQDINHGFLLPVCTLTESSIQRCHTMQGKRDL